MLSTIRFDTIDDKRHSLEALLCIIIPCIVLYLVASFAIASNLVLRFASDPDRVFIPVLRHLLYGFFLAIKESIFYGVALFLGVLVAGWLLNYFTGSIKTKKPLRDRQNNWKQVRRWGRIWIFGAIIIAIWLYVLDVIIIALAYDYQGKSGYIELPFVVTRIYDVVDIVEIAVRDQLPMNTVGLIVSPPEGLFFILSALFAVFLLRAYRNTRIAFANASAEI